MKEQFESIKSDEKINTRTERIGYIALFTGVYFLFMPFDLVSLGRIGTILRMLALLPLIAIALNYDKCTFNSKEALPIVLYAVYKQLSIVYSVFPTFTDVEAPRIAANFALILIVGSFYHLNSKEIDFLKMSLAAAGFITIALILIYADFSGAGRLTIRMSSEEVDQNYLIGYLMFILPFSIDRLLKKKRYLSVLPVIIVCVLIIMTGSRGGLLAALAVIAISGCGIVKENWNSLKKYTIPILITIGGSLIVLVFVLQYLNPEVLERFSLSYVEQNGTTGRKDIWLYFIKLFLESTPFRQFWGYGAGVSAFMNRMNTRMAGHVAHNLWVDELVTGGVIGLALLLTIHFTFMMVAIKCKDMYVVSAFVGFMIMCANLSIVSYKPMWNCMILIMLINKNRKMQLRRGAI